MFLTKRDVIVLRDVDFNEKIRGCEEFVILLIKDDIGNVNQRKPNKAKEDEDKMEETAHIPTSK